MTWIEFYIAIGVIVFMMTFIYKARTYDRSYRPGYDNGPDFMEPFWFALAVGILWGGIAVWYLIMFPFLMLYNVVYRLVRTGLDEK